MTALDGFAQGRLKGYAFDLDFEGFACQKLRERAEKLPEVEPKSQVIEIVSGPV